jgi:hypothetical protein
MKYIKTFESFSEESIDEASVPGRAWSGKLENLDKLFSWLYSKGIMSKREQASKDSIFRQYYRWYNDGDFPRAIAGTVSRYDRKEVIETALEAAIEKFMKQILNKYTGKYDRREFHIDTLLGDLKTLQDVVDRVDTHGLLNYWGKKINTNDSEFEKLLGELRPLHDDLVNSANAVIDAEKKDGVYKDAPSYEIPTNLIISAKRERMKEAGAWTDALEKKYQKVEDQAKQMSAILVNVIEGAEKIKAELGA